MYGCMEFISERIFGKYSKIKILVFNFLKRANFDAFFSPRPTKLNFFVYIQESFVKTTDFFWGGGIEKYSQILEFTWVPRVSPRPYP